MFPTLQKDTLPADPRESRAMLIAKLRGDTAYLGLRDDMRSLAERNRASLAGGRQAILSTLADQIPVLEATALRFLHDAAKPGPAASRQALAGVAMQAQKTLISTLLAMSKVYEEQADAQALPASFTEAD
jgi:hypothetical protein